jgi:hypothetical protein
MFRSIGRSRVALSGDGSLTSTTGPGRWGIPARMLLAMLGLGMPCRPATGEEPPPWSAIALVSTSYAAPADLPASSGGGEVAVGETLGEGRIHWQPRAGIRIGLGIGGGAHLYDSATLRSRFAVDGDLAAAWVRLPATVMASPHWGITTLSSFGTATDGSASFADGRQYQVEASLLFVRDRDLLISVGAVVSSRLERSASIIPLVSAYWRFADDWRLTVIDEIDNTSSLTYRLRPGLELGLVVDARFFEFALEHTDAQGAAVLRDERIIVGLGGGWRPLRDERLVVRAFVGSALVRRIVVIDGQGDEVFDASARPGFAVGCTIRSDF